MIKINVILNNILWKKYLKKPEKFFYNKVDLLNKKHIFFKGKILHLSLALSDTKQIKKLNHKFRKKNKSTDVLSFPFYENTNLKKMIKEEKNIYIGDIIINLNKVKKKKNDILFKNELIKLWTHGLLHLLGHKHKSETDYLKMRKEEEKFLNILND